MTSAAFNYSGLSGLLCLRWGSRLIGAVLFRCSFVCGTVGAKFWIPEYCRLPGLDTVEGKQEILYTHTFLLTLKTK